MLYQNIVEYSVFEIVIVIFLGLVFGSFASAIAYRVPKGISWIKKDKTSDSLRSSCPKCKAILNARDLIPLLSWLLSKGRCRHCNAPISKLYPVCELLTLLGCFGIYFSYGLTLASIPFFIMIPFLSALIIIDYKYMILPNQLVAIVFALGLVVLGMRIFEANELNVFMQYAASAILYGLIAWGLGAVMSKALKKDALGFGDVKFFATAGLWLGIAALPYFFMGAGCIGVLSALIQKKITGNEVFPFGPALILSFYGILLLQGSLFL